MRSLGPAGASCSCHRRLCPPTPRGADTTPRPDPRKSGAPVQPGQCSSGLGTATEGQENVWAFGCRSRDKPTGLCWPCGDRRSKGVCLRSIKSQLWRPIGQAGGTVGSCFWAVHGAQRNFCQPMGPTHARVRCPFVQDRPNPSSQTVVSAASASRARWSLPLKTRRSGKANFGSFNYTKFFQLLP